jgi:SAM-dependent methyltransferase
VPWLKDNYQRWFPSLTWQAAPQIPRVMADVPPGARVLDLGAGGRRIREDVICVDFIPFDGTTVVGDVQRLPFASGSVDVIIGTGLLEHVEDDRALLEQCYRILKPGGLAHFEVPFLQQYHDDPIDCRRFTVDGLRRALVRTGFEPQQHGAHIGPTVTLITLFSYYVAVLLEGKNIALRALSTGAFLFFSIVLWPAKFLDRFLIGKRSAQRLAFGVYGTARKPA